MQRKDSWFYSLLAVSLVLVVAWQVIEHFRVREQARKALIGRGRDITSTVGLVISSQRRFAGIVSKERLESSIAALVRDDVVSIALLNSDNEVVVASGEPVSADDVLDTPSGLSWESGRMWLANLVDLGTNQFSANSEPRRAVVVPFGPPPGGDGSNAPSPNPFFPPPRPDGPRPEGSRPEPRQSETRGAEPNDSLPPVAPVETVVSSEDRPPRPPRDSDEASGEPPRRPPPSSASSRSSRSRSSFGRPPWMGEDEFNRIIRQQGLHSFIIVMSAASIREASSQDARVRLLVALLAIGAAAGAVVAWRSLHRSAELELRLIKASEMNSHLKQMNLAAAGLAHETRNPLNIIRGLAQLISRQEESPAPVRDQSRAIVEEADRVTSQLNEFINYSRPREVRLSRVAAGKVVSEVARALGYDTEEKQVHFKLPETELAIEADEQLLRQALFNLLLNAVQAVDDGGEITVTWAGGEGDTVAIEVRDNGPGVPPERRVEIFKPYFTTHARGTGLGLAVVQQIATAHGWIIECLGNEPRGALFRIGRIKKASPN